MVFVDPKNLGYHPYWERWRLALPKDFRKEFENLYKKYMVPLVDLVIEAMQDGQPIPKLKTILPISNLNLVSGAFI